MYIDCKFSEQNGKVFLFTLPVVVVANLAILRSNLLYVDDAARVYNFGSINQGVHGRPFADLFYKLLTSGIFIDFSPLSQIIALSCLVWSGILICEVFFRNCLNRKLVLKAKCLTSFVLSVFPLNYSIISYRFDSLSFGLAILFAVYGFLAVAKEDVSKKEFLIHSCIGGVLLAVTMGLYQPFWGVYTCCCFFYIIAMLLSNEKNKLICTKILKLFLSCLISGCLYLPIYLYARYEAAKDFFGLGPHPYVSRVIQLPEPSSFFRTLIANTKHWLEAIYSYSGPDAPTLSFAFLIVLFLTVIIQKKISIQKKFFAIFTLPAAFVSCFGVQIFLLHPSNGTRVSVSLCAFAACIFSTALCHANSFIYKKIIYIVAVYFILTSSVLLTAIGNAQRDQYNFQNEIVFNNLGIDLMRLCNRNNNVKFYISNVDEPICTSLQLLSEKYGFLREGGAMSNNIFVAQKYLSYLPVNYYIKGSFQEISISDIDPVIETPNYSIKKILDDTYAVTLKALTPHIYTSDRLR